MTTTMTEATLDLQRFYPAELKILDVADIDDEIIIQMHSVSKTSALYKRG